MIRPVPITWQDAGSGDVVVLLHGLGGDRGFWDGSSLAEHFRVVAIDLRGSGGTPATRDGHTMLDLADDVVAVLDELGATRAHVVGFSMGGLVAQAFAVRHPDRLDRLVLASTYARISTQARMFLDAIADLVRQGCSDGTVFGLVGPWLFSDSFVADPSNRAFLEIPADEAESYPGNAWLNQYAAQRQFDGTAAAADILAPTLVLGGGEDHLIPRADIAYLAEQIPDATISMFEGSGHLINFEESQRFDDEVAAFLALRAPVPPSCWSKVPRAQRR
ncbi:alpha/beta fold hydrolase [Gordonia sp. NPDC003422]